MTIKSVSAGKLKGNPKVHKPGADLGILVGGGDIICNTYNPLTPPGSTSELGQTRTVDSRLSDSLMGVSNRVRRPRANPQIKYRPKYEPTCHQ